MIENRHASDKNRSISAGTHGHRRSQDDSTLAGDGAFPSVRITPDGGADRSDGEDVCDQGDQQQSEDHANESEWKTVFVHENRRNVCNEGVSLRMSNAASDLSTRVRKDYRRPQL